MGQSTFNSRRNSFDVGSIDYDSAYGHYHHHFHGSFPIREHEMSREMLERVSSMLRGHHISAHTAHQLFVLILQSVKDPREFNIALDSLNEVLFGKGVPLQPESFLDIQDQFKYFEQRRRHSHYST